MLERFDPRPRLARRPPRRADQRRSHVRLGQYLRLAHDSLLNVDRSGTHLLQRRHHDQRIVEPCRGAVADRECGDGIGASACLLVGALVDPDEPQHVRTGTLHVAQVIGVIDDARQVGILEIDAHRETMRAVDKAARSGLVEVPIRHGQAVNPSRPAREPHHGRAGAVGPSRKAIGRDKNPTRAATDRQSEEQGVNHVA